MPKKSRIKQFGRHPYLILLSTFPTRKDAERVAKGLIQKKLAACCNLIPGLVSFYLWKGKQERSKECLLFIKTERGSLEKAAAFLKAHHPYELPELIGVPITAGESAYLSWIDRACR